MWSFVIVIVGGSAGIVGAYCGAGGIEPRGASPVTSTAAVTMFMLPSGPSVKGVEGACCVCIAPGVVGPLPLPPPLPACGQRARKC